MSLEKQTIGVRLAIRREGKLVNAYLATAGSMDGAILMGSILRSIVARDDALWERWKAVMTDAMRNAVEDTFGQRPDVTERPAPPHEKAGEA